MCYWIALQLTYLRLLVHDVRQEGVLPSARQHVPAGPKAAETAASAAAAPWLALHAGSAAVVSFPAPRCPSVVVVVVLRIAVAGVATGRGQLQGALRTLAHDAVGGHPDCAAAPVSPGRAGIAVPGPHPVRVHHTGRAAESRPTRHRQVSWLVPRGSLAVGGIFGTSSGDTGLGVFVAGLPVVVSVPVAALRLRRRLDGCGTDIFSGRGGRLLVRLGLLVWCLLLLLLLKSGLHCWRGDGGEHCWSLCVGGRLQGLLCVGGVVVGLERRAQVHWRRAIGIHWRRLIVIIM